MTARLQATDFVYEVIKEYGKCTKTGAVTIIEQFIDNDGDEMWSWHVTVPRVRLGTIINGHRLSGDAVRTKGLARSKARAAVAEFLKHHDLGMT